jgi:stearoyl-CoA desaturase (Delta-9 desaturase)
MVGSTVRSIPQPRCPQTAAPTLPAWPHDLRGCLVLVWLVMIHVAAAVGLVLYPFPGWRLPLAALAVAFLGGAGVTICYHRGLAHRSLALNPAVRSILILFAMFNGTPPPYGWVAGHRFHHATADTPADLSSPIWYGLWSAHVAQYWQAGRAIPRKYSEDLKHLSLRAWDSLLVPIFVVAFFGGAWFGLAGFFWLGAIRLVFAFHAQSLVNSVCHTQPGVRPGEDSSRNVWWVGLMQLFLGENWHRNHHASPSSARLGRGWRQPDVGYLIIVGLQRLGLARDVRRLERGRVVMKDAKSAAS